MKQKLKLITVWGNLHGNYIYTPWHSFFIKNAGFYEEGNAYWVIDTSKECIVDGINP